MRRLLFGIICANAVQADLVEVSSILIEDNFKQELPSELPEMLYTAARLKIPRLFFDQKTIHLTEAERGTIQNTVSLKAGPAIGSILNGENGKVKIFFKRYYSPVVLSGLDAKIVRKLPEPVLLEKLTGEFSKENQQENIWESIKRLENTHILKIYLDE